MCTCIVFIYFKYISSGTNKALQIVATKRLAEITSAPALVENIPVTMGRNSADPHASELDQSLGFLFAAEVVRFEW